jgi:1,4-dihydroxy-2-naphthoate octaprenyltransferase
MKLQTFVQITRAPFFLATLALVVVGAVLAWYEGSLHWGYLLLSLVGVACINAGLNMSNDYYDHVLGSDEVNTELTPFSGGSRTIQNGILTAKQVLTWSLVFFAIGAAIGLYLSVARGWTVLWLGILGVFLAFFSSAPPISLNYVGYGLGELATGIGCGPTILLGSYYVQAQRLTWEAFWLSIPMGLLATAIIWINEFPDHDADKTVGKNTLVVVLGKERAAWGYVGLLVATYVVIAAGSLFGPFPNTVLVALLSVPLAYKCIRGVLAYHSDTRKLVPTSAATIQLYVANALLLCIGYVIAALIR